MFVDRSGWSGGDRVDAAFCVRLGLLLVVAACKAKTEEPPKNNVKEEGIDIELGPKALAAAQAHDDAPSVRPARRDSGSDGAG